MELIAQKLKMTQLFKEKNVYAVTVLKIKETADFSLLKEGTKVNIQAKTKGKGFQGTVKRWGFSGGPTTHGQKDRLRAPGSIGATTPQRVIPGKKMAGRMGNKKRLVRNLEVMKVDAENKIIYLKGPIPGPYKSECRIKI